MNTSGKWLARAGGLLVMVGFVLPTISVSCAGAPLPGGALSLSNIATLPYSSITLLLYLVPIGGLALLIFSFLPTADPSVEKYYWIGQTVSAGASLLSVIVSLVTIYVQVGQTQVLQVSPQIGAFILLIGYILIVIGLIFQWQEMGEATSYGQVYAAGAQEQPPQQVYGSGAGPRESAQIPEARLEVLRGSFPYSVIPINNDDFSIGRSSSNNLQVTGSTVSRQHARIRFAQNAWFIQDWESTGGTYVNGQVVQATRLNPGDEITIGENSFLFLM